MSNYSKALPDPVDFSIKTWAVEGLLAHESSACISLLRLIRGVLHSQDVTKDDVHSFTRLTSSGSGGCRSIFAIRYVLFQNVVRSIIDAPDVIPNPSVLDPIPRLIRLAVDTKIQRDALPPNAPVPFTRRVLFRALSDLYFSPYVSTTCPQPIKHNFPFHIFAASLYGSGAFRKPIFFLCAMADALEERWEDAGRLLRALYAVYWWVIHFGYQLFRRYSAKNCTYSGPMRYGDLYEENLIRTYGEIHPSPGLTVHRWRYWKQRLEESMIDVVEIESKNVLTGPKNIAWQAAEKIGRILLRNGYEV